MLGLLSKMYPNLNRNLNVQRVYNNNHPCKFQVATPSASRWDETPGRPKGGETPGGGTRWDETPGRAKGSETPGGSTTPHRGSETPGATPSARMWEATPSHATPGSTTPGNITPGHSTPGQFRCKSERSKI